MNPTTPASEVMAATDSVSIERYLMVANSLHDNIVGMQAAWIEWRRGAGAEAAMQWIENALRGPGFVPNESEPYSSEPQAYFDANQSNPMPQCACGRPSNIGWMGQGFCSREHYNTARKAQSDGAIGESK